MESEKICTFPGAPGLIDMVIRFLLPSEVAGLALCSTWIRDSALEDVRWYKYYLDEFKRPATRGACDSALPISSLFSRRWMRRNFKNQAEPIVRRLDLARARPGPSDDGGKNARDSAGQPASRSRSRGESMDESKQAGVYQARDGQEQEGSGRSGGGGVEGLPGAMRFVHLGKHGVAIGSTDQGHTAAWLLHPRRPQGMAPSAQCDAFDAAMCAKRRRDAKRKYMDGARKENKLVYFKIQAAATRAGRVSGGGSLDDEFTGFSMWGEGGGAVERGPDGGPHSKSERSDSDAQGEDGRSGASDTIDSDSSVRSGSDPRVSSTPWLDWASADRDKAGGFDRSGGRRGKGAGKGRAAHSEPMENSDKAGESDNADLAGRHGSLDSAGGDGGGGYTPGGAHSDDSTGGGAGPGAGRRGSKGKVRGEDKPKLKGKDLWSAADRAKWEEKQAKAEARQAALKAKQQGKCRVGQTDSGTGTAEAEADAVTSTDVVAGPAVADYSAFAGSAEPMLGLGFGLGLGTPQVDAPRPTSPVTQEADIAGRRKPYPSKAERKALRKLSTGSDLEPPPRPVTPTHVPKAGASALTSAHGGATATGQVVPSMEDIEAALLQGLGTYNNGGEAQASSGDDEGQDREEGVNADHDPVTMVNLRQGLSETSELKPSSLVRRGKKANRKAREQAEWAAAQEAKAKRVAAGGKLSRQGGLAPAVKVFDDAPPPPVPPSKSPVQAPTTPTKSLAAAAGLDAFPPPSALMSRRPPTSPPLKAIAALTAGTRSTSPLPSLGLGLGLAPPTAAALVGAGPPSPTEESRVSRSSSAGGTSMTPTHSKAFHPLLRPSSAGSRTPTTSGPQAAPSSLAGSTQLSSSGGPSGLGLGGSDKAHTHGTRLRSDIWFAAQWAHQEQPMRRKWQMPRPSSSAVHTPFSPPYGVSLEPRPAGSGMGLTFHAVVCFGDGTVGIVSPQAVSPKLNDVVLLPSDTGATEDSTPQLSSSVKPAAKARGSVPSATSGSVGKTQACMPPLAAEAQHLAPPKTKHARQDGGVYVPPWMQRSMTWLDRPQGEDKEAVSAVVVEAGRPYVHGHTPAGIAPEGDTPVAAVVSDREPDTVVASFGRVVGVWRFTVPRTLAPSTASQVTGGFGALIPSPPPSKDAAARSRTLSDLDLGMRAPADGSTTTASVSSLVPGQVMKGKGGKGGKEKGGLGGGSKDHKAGKADATISPRASTSRDPTESSIPGIGQDADRSMAPLGVARLHAHVVTALAAHRRLQRRDVVHVSAGTASMVQCGSSPAPQAGEDCISIASGDANGDILLWDAGSQGKVAALQINRRGGAGKEGVACLRLHDEVVVAGGSEGTVVVWKRRFSRHAVPPPAPAAAPHGAPSLTAPLWLEVETAPELIFRETRAHSIVRVIAVPPPSVRLCAVVTGGGEGDVRLWPLPSMFTHTPAQAQGSSSAPSTPIEGSTPAPVALHAASTPSPPPCKVLKGHSARITGLHVDAVKIVSCSLDGTAKVWDLMEHSLGRNLATLRVPAGDELSSLHVFGRDILLGGVHGAVHHFRFTHDGPGLGDKEEAGAAQLTVTAGGTGGGMLSATGSGGSTALSGMVSQSSTGGAGSGPNGGATLKDQLWHGVTGGSTSSRKGGAEAAYGGRNAGGKRDKPASHVKRRGMRDLRALVKVQGASVDALGLGHDEMGQEDEEPLTPHERAQLAEIEDEQLAIAMAASLT